MTNAKDTLRSAIQSAMSTDSDDPGAAANAITEILVAFAALVNPQATDLGITLPGSNKVFHVPSATDAEIAAAVRHWVRDGRDWMGNPVPPEKFIKQITDLVGAGTAISQEPIISEAATNAFR
ncbi:MAG: hypothetical protein V4463_05325 [Pseudomonadota bacterium]